MQFVQMATAISEQVLAKHQLWSPQ